MVSTADAVCTQLRPSQQQVTDDAAAPQLLFDQKLTDLDLKSIDFSHDQFLPKLVSATGQNFILTAYL